MESSFNVCCNCKLHFNLKDQKPITLPCGDNFCELCYQALSDPQNNDLIKCPLDGEVCPKPPKTFYNRGIMATLEKMKMDKAMIVCQKHPE